LEVEGGVRLSLHLMALLDAEQPALSPEPAAELAEL
jgi:hypothetical protein